MMFGKWSSAFLVGLPGVAAMYGSQIGGYGENLFVKILTTGKTICLEVNSYVETVTHVKQMIYERQGTLPFFQTLIFSGKFLPDDGKILSEYGIQRESTVYLVTWKLKETASNIDPDEHKEFIYLIKTLDGKKIAIPKQHGIRELLLDDKLPAQERVTAYQAKAKELWDKFGRHAKNFLIANKEVWILQNDGGICTFEKPLQNDGGICAFEKPFDKDVAGVRLSHQCVGLSEEIILESVCFWRQAFPTFLGQAQTDGKKVYFQDKGVVKTAPKTFGLLTRYNDLVIRITGFL